MEPKTPKDGLPAIFAGRMPSNISHARDERRPGSSSRFGESPLPDGPEPSTELDLGSLACPVSASPCWKEEGVMRGEGGRSRLPCDGTLQLFGLFVEK